MKKLATVIMIGFFIAGCGRHCISVAGDYQGIDGQVEYCFDTKEAKAGGVPVFTEDGKTSYYGFTVDEINAIIAKLQEKAGVSALAKPEAKKHPARKLKKLLEVKENGKHN